MSLIIVFRKTPGHAGYNAGQNKALSFRRALIRTVEGSATVNRNGKPGIQAQRRNRRRNGENTVKTVNRMAADLA
jgi:hypothetical protein